MSELLAAISMAQKSPLRWGNSVPRCVTSRLKAITPSSAIWRVSRFRGRTVNAAMSEAEQEQQAAYSKAAFRFDRDPGYESWVRYDQVDIFGEPIV